jgi:hypothetical protein
MEGVTLTYTESDACHNSISCRGCAKRFAKNTTIRVEKKNGKHQKKIVTHSNKIWNKDVTIFQKELSCDYPPEKNHFVVVHINHDIDVLLESTKEVIPASHCIMVNQFTTLKEAQAFTKYNHIIYEVSAMNGKYTILYEQTPGSFNKFICL